MLYRSSMSRLLRILICTWGFSSLALASTWDVQENCDIPSASLRDLKTDDRESCQKVCEDTASCQGVVYITGWKKCSLKASIKKKASLQFISGDLDSKHSYAMGSFQVDHDHSGKDLERLVLDDADKCGKACEARADCAAFTYLKGYQVCWLKHGVKGRLSSKVFSCSFKKT